MVPESNVYGSYIQYSKSHSGELLMPNAAPQPRPEAIAERRLEGVGCRRLILIEAPSSAYPDGMLRVGNYHS